MKKTVYVCAMILTMAALVGCGSENDEEEWETYSYVPSYGNADTSPAYRSPSEPTCSDEVKKGAKEMARLTGMIKYLREQGSLDDVTGMSYVQAIAVICKEAKLDSIANNCITENRYKDYTYLDADKTRQNCALTYETLEKIQQLQSQEDDNQNKKVSI